jgi:hypothetical protein
MTSQFPTAVKERLKVSPSQIADFCQRWNIIELGLVGSLLRNDFRPDSDTDILASFAPNACWNLFDFIKMQEQLETMLGRSVDLTDKQQLDNPFSRAEILRKCHIIYCENRTILLICGISSIAGTIACSQILSGISLQQCCQVC